MRENENRPSSLKKLLTLLAAVVGIFLVINLIWLLFAVVPAANFQKKCDQRVEKASQEDLIELYEQYPCEVKKPSYMRFDIFCEISDGKQCYEKYDKDGNLIEVSGACCSLDLITNRLKGRKTYRLWIIDLKNDLDRCIYVDEELHLLYRDEMSEEAAERTQKLIEQHYQTVSGLMKCAVAIWGQA